MSFREIINQYRKQPQCKQETFRTVVLEQSDPGLEVAATGDIISFYNQVFVPCMKSHLLQSCSAPGPGPVPTPLASMSGALPPPPPQAATAVIGPGGKLSPIPGSSHTSPILAALQQTGSTLGRSPLGRSPLQQLQPAAYRSLFQGPGGPIGQDGTSPVPGTSPANPSRLRQSSGMMPPPPRPPASTAAFLAATAVGAGPGGPAAAHSGPLLGLPPHALEISAQRLERAHSAGRSTGSARSSPRTSARGSPARGSPARSGPGMAQAEHGEEVEGVRRSSRRQPSQPQQQEMPSGLATLLMALDSTQASADDDDGDGDAERGPARGSDAVQAGA